MKRLLSLAILLLVPVLPLHAAERKPGLWAVYYAWYQTHGKSSMWTVEGSAVPRSKAQPLIGYYDSDDPKVVGWHIQLAKTAGIDAFLVSWWGGANISGQAFEKVILPVAADEKWIMDKVTNTGNRGLRFPDEWLKIPEVPLFGFYGTFSIKRVWKYEDLALQYARLVQQAHAAGKKVCLPAHPGHDNSGFRPNDFFVIPRDDAPRLSARGDGRRRRRGPADQLQRVARDHGGRTLVVLERSVSLP